MTAQQDGNTFWSLAGVLLGMEGQGRRGLSRSLRTTIEGAIVTAANLALEDPANTGPFGQTRSFSRSIIRFPYYRTSLEPIELRRFSDGLA